MERMRDVQLRFRVGEVGFGKLFGSMNPIGCLGRLHACPVWSYTTGCAGFSCSCTSRAGSSGPIFGQFIINLHFDRWRRADHNHRRMQVLRSCYLGFIVSRQADRRWGWGLWSVECVVLVQRVSHSRQFIIARRWRNRSQGHYLQALAFLRRTATAWMVAESWCRRKLLGNKALRLYGRSFSAALLILSA